MNLRTLKQIWEQLNNEIFSGVLYPPRFFRTRSSGEYASYVAGVAAQSELHFNTTAINEFDYFYEYGNNASTFADSGGEVAYNDIQEGIEYLTIYYPPAVPENLITEITFKVNEKSQLNIIIFADGIEVYNALKIRNDIFLDLTIPATEIVVYVF